MNFFLCAGNPKTAFSLPGCHVMYLVVGITAEPLSVTERNSIIISVVLHRLHFSSNIVFCADIAIRTAVFYTSLAQKEKPLPRMMFFSRVPIFGLCTPKLLQAIGR